jgi:hypothetical protein
LIPVLSLYVEGTFMSGKMKEEYFFKLMIMVAGILIKLTLKDWVKFDYPYLIYFFNNFNKYDCCSFKSM